MIPGGRIGGDLQVLDRGTGGSEAGQRVGLGVEDIDRPPQWFQPLSANRPTLMPVASSR